MFIRIVLIAVAMQFSESVSPDIFADPNFSAPITNVTVPTGREAILTCVVHDLFSYKVAWLHVDSQTILTIQNRVITKDRRIGIKNTENRIWQLHIKNIKMSDQGLYMCQINTDPMKSQLGYLNVVVPPDIIDYETSTDMVVDEGSNVNLTCTVVGLPEPTVEWKREGNLPIMQFDSDEIYTVRGSNLIIRNVKRHQMGTYFCIASNGIPPSVSKRIILKVNYLPTIWTKHEHVHTSIGQKIAIECISEAHPKTKNYWLHNMDYVQGGIYETFDINHVYRTSMKLVIRPKNSSDFGSYRCVARNSMGEAERAITIKQRSAWSKTDSTFHENQVSHIVSSRADHNTIDLFLRSIASIYIFSKILKRIS